MSTAGEGVRCSLKRAHHHNHGSRVSICRSNGSPGRMSRAAKKLRKPGGPLPAPNGAFKACHGCPHLLPGLQSPPPPAATFAAPPLNSPGVSPGLAVAFIFHAEYVQLPGSPRHALHSDARPAGGHGQLRACLMRRRPLSGGGGRAGGGGVSGRRGGQAQGRAGGCLFKTVSVTRYCRRGPVKATPGIGWRLKQGAMQIKERTWGKA